MVSKKTVYLLCLFVVAMLFLYGCTPSEPEVVPITGIEPTPVVVPTTLPVAVPVEPPDSTVITFPDGSVLYLRPEAKVEIISYKDISTGTGENQIRLSEGEALLVPGIDSEGWSTVFNADGNVARVQGCGMAVRMDPSAKSFWMGCVGGMCEMGEDDTKFVPVGMEESMSFSSGVAQGKEILDLTKLEETFPGLLPDCPPIPVTGGGETPPPPADLSATATASCQSFSQQFPGTPCP